MAIKEESPNLSPGIRMLNPMAAGAGLVGVSYPCAGSVQGSILQNSISAENFSNTFSSSNFGQLFTQKQHMVINLCVVVNNLEF
jgi:uncharacterized membrane protein